MGESDVVFDEGNGKNHQALQSKNLCRKAEASGQWTGGQLYGFNQGSPGLPPVV